MDLDTFKDILFGILNETDDLPIQDIVVHDKENKIILYLTDGTVFQITSKKQGNWWLMQQHI